MARFTEAEARALLKRTGQPVLDDRPCDKCGGMYSPNSGSQKYCPACQTRRKPTYDNLVQRPKRKRGERGATHAARDTLKPDDSVKGTLRACPTCGVTWVTATRRYTKVIGGVGFDFFKCGCKGGGYEYDRWTGE